MHGRVAGLSPAKQALLARKLAGRKRAAAGPILPRTSTGPAPLTSAQQLVWLFEQMTPDTAAYSVPIVRRLLGSVDAAALQRAIDAVVARHEILRTTYAEVAGAPVQLARPTMPAALRVVDLRSGTAETREATAIALLQDEAATPFDLTRGPMLRAVLVQLSDSESLLLLLAHHIAVDGASIGVIMREISTLYSRGAEPLPALPIQYADYAEWEQQALSGDRLERLLAYWRNALDGAPGAVALPFDWPRTASAAGRGARHVTTLPSTLATAIGALARRRGVTPYVAYLAAFQALLHRYSGQNDIVVGSPTAGRTHTETQDLVGYFVNTLALRARFDNDPTFVQLLAQLKDASLGALEHQELPHEKLVLDLQAGRTDASAGLFSVMFTLQDRGAPALRLGEATAEPAAIDVGASKFDLSLSLTETAGGLRISVEYRADLFDAGTIERFVTHYQSLMRGVIDAPDTVVSKLPLITPAERRQVLVEWNDTAVEYAGPGTLLDLLEAQAIRTPSAVAVEHEGDPLTYEELHARADILAQWLRSRGVGPGSLVAVCLERSANLVVALLGVLKAGAAYVPLDPEYPADRLAYMLTDAGAAVIISEQRMLGLLPATTCLTLALDTDWRSALAGTAGQRGARPQPDHPAYMIYTSGSTGRPKGALNSHRGIANRLQWMQAEYRLTAGDAVLQKTPASFDVSVWEFFWPLMAGARLVLASPGGHRDPRYLMETIARYNVTVLHFVPSMLAVFLAAPELEGCCASVRDVICSGEALSSDLARRFFAALPLARLHNLYGPTEAAVDVSYLCCARDEPRAMVPIGRPVANTRLYVLDVDMQPSPIGVPGELYIGGVQVGMGYHRRKELTAERFILDPFAPGRLYRTGDRARWLADGTIEFLGRLDCQVKIRGQRVELGEIEALLAAMPGVATAAAIVYDVAAGDSRLVAYVVPTHGLVPDVSALLAALRRAVPAAMVPSALVVLDALPLTPNGKLDRRALPAPEFGADEFDAVYVSPRTATEEIVASVWCEVLHRKRLSVDRDFFELGGHSLLAMQIVSRIARLFRATLPLRRFFEQPTIAGVAAELVVTEPKTGQTEAIARALIKLRSMSPEERQARRNTVADSDPSSRRA